MIVRLISTWHPGHQAPEEERQFGLAAANRRGEASELSTAVTGSDVSSNEYDERYLMAAAESMLRAGYGQRQIERALRRMSPNGIERFRSARHLRLASTPARAPQLEASRSWSGDKRRRPFSPRIDLMPSALEGI